MGNSLINAATFYHVFKHELFGMDKNVSKALILGDDNIFATNEDLDIDEIQKAYADYGLKVKVEITRDITTTKFL